MKRNGRSGKLIAGMTARFLKEVDILPSCTWWLDSPAQWVIGLIFRQPRSRRLAVAHAPTASLLI
jgi:hypothetical protein